MKPLYVFVLISCLPGYLVFAQDIENRIIRKQVSSELVLDKANCDLLGELNKDSLLELINKSKPDTGFSDWINSDIKKESLQKRAIFVYTNLNPKHIGRLEELSKLETLIEKFSEDIGIHFKEFEKFKNDTMTYASAERARGLISNELKKLKQGVSVDEYERIRESLISSINPAKGLDAVYPPADKLCDMIETIVAIRELRIKEYTDLHQSIFDIHERAKLTILHWADSKWDDDPIGCQQLLLVIIDGNGKLSKSTFYAENFKSAVVQEFKDLVDLVKNAGIFSLGLSGSISLPTTSARLTLLEVDKEKIDPPGNIVAIVPFKEDSKNKTDTIKVKIKEKINLSFRVGVSTALIDRKIFKIENKQLIINLDSAQKEEWKQHLVVTFNLNPWYRTGDYSPKMFRYDKDNSVLKRFSLFTGMNLSLTPLDNIYLGAAYDLSKNFTINAGCTWNNTIESRAIDIGDIDTVKDALKLSNKKYGDAKWFFALTFRPTVLSEILGLGKKDED